MSAPTPPVRRSRRAFWGFVAAMVVAVLGGGSVVLLARRAVEQHRADEARIEAERAAAAERARGAAPR
jgi:hypothetical protein